MKITHCCAAILASLSLSACTQFLQFDTDKRFDENAPVNKSARVKFTTDNSDVFVLPGSSCLKINDTVVKAVEAFNSLKHTDSENSQRVSITKGASKKEFNYKSINMPHIPLEHYQKNYATKLVDDSYISREYRLEAEKPYTIFVKVIGKEASILSKIFDKQEDIYGFALSFTPESGHDYQVIMSSKYSSNEQSSSYIYAPAFFDITDPKNVKKLDHPKEVIVTNSCKGIW
ncbi:hypothetical protein EDC45_0755 [Mesocricetibacter intestinalis]|uniref:Lipoprotein n=1 Tax=Mesocricetibacter intestinalis TaxID=1521930 RepID=A0A4R6VB99_9PAST|nr:hypothetical protein [Mesocricetibacter intestinalis]TDQ58963.1 hypothetical protein EDC45_0755 [Mesocricetibacter intestinalis]